MKAQTRLVLLALCSVPFIMVLGNSMLIPVLPRMQEAMSITKFQSGLLITAFSIPAGIVILVGGFLSDRFGRKRVMVPALILYGVGGAISGVAAWVLAERAFGLVLTGRVVQGIGAAGTAPVAMALVGDLFQSRERAKALGTLEAANGLGKVLSPVLGAGAALLTWWTPFLAYAVLSLPAAAAVALVVRERPKQPGSAKGMGSYFGALRKVVRRKLAGLAVSFWSGTVVLFILFGLLFFLSEILERRFQIDGLLKGAIIAVPVLAMATTAFFTGSFLQRRAAWLKPAVVTGFSLSTGGLALVPLVGATWALFAGVIISGVGAGLVLTSLNTLVTSAAAKEERGMVTSAYGAVRFFGVALGPPIFGMLMEAGRYVPFWFSAGLAAASALLAWWLIRPKQLMGEALVSGSGQRWQPPEQTDDRRLRS